MHILCSWPVLGWTSSYSFLSSVFIVTFWGFGHQGYFRQNSHFLFKLNQGVKRPGRGTALPSLHLCGMVINWAQTFYRFASIFNEKLRRRSVSQRSEMLAEFLVGKPEHHVENWGVDNMKINLGKYCWKGWTGFVWRSVENSGWLVKTVMHGSIQLWEWCIKSRVNLFHGHCYNKKCFDVLLTVHLSIILAFDQLNAQILVL